MGSRNGKLFGSKSGSEDITPVPNKPKKATKGSTVTNLAQSVPDKPTPTAAAVSEPPSAQPDVTNELPEYLSVFCKGIAEKEGFTDYTLEMSAGSKHGDGFFGLMKRVVISGTRNGKPEQLPLVCKLMPSSKARREQFNSDAVFVREAYMYTEVFPVFADFQKEKGFIGEDSFCQYPKCYGVLDEREKDRFVIVLEDLRDQGYLMCDKFKAADFNHVKFLVETLGKLHAVSLALKDQRPEVFAKFKDLKDVFLLQAETQPEVIRAMFKNFLDKSITVFKPEEETEIKTLNRLKENVVEELIRVGSGANSEPFSIISHGDCWINNMMYAYGTESNVPVRMSLIDFQISRYCSPVLDLLFFLFTSTDKALRDAHYTELLQLYHKTLSTNLTKMGSDPSKIFTFDDLQDQLKNFGSFGLIIAPMFLNVISVKQDDIPDLDELAEQHKGKPAAESMSTFMGGTSDMFISRVRGVVQDIIRLGYY